MEATGICLANILSRKRAVVRAPTRVDLGGGIDHRAISLLCGSNNLATFNIAIKLYSHVRLEPYKKGKILVSSNEIGEKELDFASSYFNDQFGLIAAISSYFGVHGVKINIKLDYPTMSGLGGSGSIAVALISAFMEALNIKYKLKKKGIVWLSHSIEDALFKNTGMQDQAAACYGGINVWEWEYDRHEDLYRKVSLENLPIDFEKSSILVYSGCPHYLSQKGSKIVHLFLNKANGVNFVKQVIINTKQFLLALNMGDLDKAAHFLNQEEKLRRNFLKYRMPINAIRVIDQARKRGCGVKFTGGGGGGCLWILGRKDKVKVVAKDVSQMEGVIRLPFFIDRKGVQVSTNDR